MTRIYVIAFQLFTPYFANSTYNFTSQIHKFDIPNTISIGQFAEVGPRKETLPWRVSLMFLPLLIGVSGRVKMNQYGDRVPHLVIRNFINVKHPTDSQEVVASFDGTTNNYVTVKTKYHFLGNLQKPPPDRETCGFMDDKCPGKSSLLVFFIVTCA